jgi:hypothetical protein
VIGGIEKGFLVAFLFSKKGVDTSVEGFWVLHNLVHNMYINVEKFRIESSFIFIASALYQQKNSNNAHLIPKFRKNTEKFN